MEPMFGADSSIATLPSRKRDAFHQTVETVLIKKSARGGTAMASRTITPATSPNFVDKLTVDYVPVSSDNLDIISGISRKH